MARRQNPGLDLRLRVDAAQGLLGPAQLQGRQNLGAQAALGYTPVQNGGGIGQTASGANVLKLGYATGGGGTKLTVDATDLGTVWTDNLAGKLFTGNGYQKLPSGLIIQWGSINAGGNLDPTVTFPVAFPNAVLVVTATALGYGGTGAGYAVSTSSPQPGYFAVYPRYLTNGGGVAQASVYVFWIAIGY